jgi:predicted O-methyltransferase YrrM
MDSFKDIEMLTKNAGTYLLHLEGPLLYNLAKKCTGKGVIVEIGSWKGRSTIWLAKGSKSGKRVRIFAIDPHTGSPEHKKQFGKVWTFDEFRKNIKFAKVSDIITPIVKTSQDAAKRFDKPVELIFIDGAHDYLSVKQDFDLWFPKVMVGGVMAFHDTTDIPGPRKFVKKFVFKSRYFRNVRFANSVTYATKVQSNSLLDRMRNGYHMCLKDFYLYASKIPLPGFLKSFGRKVIN